MKRHFLLSGLLLSAALASGCASGPVGPSADDSLDQARMAAVERAATVNGVRVIWVNPPRKSGS